MFVVLVDYIFVDLLVLCVIVMYNLNTENNYVVINVIDVVIHGWKCCKFMLG